MPVKITVQGQTRAEIRKSILGLAEAFQVELPSPASETVDLTTLVDILVERLLAEGLDCRVVQLAYDARSGGGRRKRKAAEKSASAPAADTVDKTDWEAHKAACIRRIKEVYFLAGGAAIIDGILREYGGGAATFTAVDADQFGFIEAAMREKGVWDVQ